ncbi:hypothetical protein L9H78_09500 [Corynebacterium pseudodiphtheriticum]|uniref:hypothetical protein n=1 Tax=Corynebacterium pseudodiphtheriticum TaxID=37637 RepID=UPI0020BF3209|nr:hypothetical protein [Corynebacterium pseudodiphtheriticum]UQV58041.1 hypothetical protein L9H78_09500 [Corynebacterium pseudodiphtheriticum]
MKAVFRTLLALGVISEIAVVTLSVTSSVLSGWWVLAPISVIAVAFMLLFVGMATDRRKKGSWSVSLSETADRFGVPRVALALLVSEISSLWSLTKIFTRPSSPAGADAHPGYKNLRTVVTLIVVLVIVESIVIHLAVPSQFWRILLLVLSIYALLLLIGFYTSIKVNPHLLTPRGLEIRRGHRFVCEIPWENLARAKKAGPGQGGDIIINEDGEARLPVLSEVNVRLEMEPLVLAEDLHKGRVYVTAVEIYCDDRNSFLDSVAEAWHSRTM